MDAEALASHVNCEQCFLSDNDDDDDIKYARYAHEFTASAVML